VLPGSTRRGTRRRRPLPADARATRSRGWGVARRGGDPVGIDSGFDSGIDSVRFRGGRGGDGARAGARARVAPRLPQVADEVLLLLLLLLPAAVLVPAAGARRGVGGERGRRGEDGEIGEGQGRDGAERCGAAEAVLATQAGLELLRGHEHAAARGIGDIGCDSREGILVLARREADFGADGAGDAGRVLHVGATFAAP
jgi:hypothetical protein